MRLQTSLLKYSKTNDFELLSDKQPDTNISDLINEENISIAKLSQVYQLEYETVDLTCDNILQLINRLSAETVSSFINSIQY